jgi:hypothetical protein
MEKNRSWFTTKEAKEITGFGSVMMMHYLVRERIVRPTRQGRKGKGKTLRYTYGDLVVLKAVKKILDAGVSTRKLKRAFSDFQQKYRHLSPEEIRARLAMKNSFAVVGDEVVFIDERDGTATEVSRNGQLTFVFGGFDKEAEEVFKAATAIEAKRSKTAA